MRIKLLIATADISYAEHLSDTLSEKHAQNFEVRVCTSADRLHDLLAADKFDSALLESDFLNSIPLSAIRLPLLLVDEFGFAAANQEGLKRINKYQRISSLAGKIMEYFAEVSVGMSGLGETRARITAVWSPSGGTGKTTVALSYAANRVSAGKQAVYLNLESFSSTPVYFQETGASISKLFEKLESNAQMFQKAIKQLDPGTGIAYFCGPENYDDVNVLSDEDIEHLLKVCAGDTDELIVDLSSQCDRRTQKILGLADTVLLICDLSVTSQAKLKQFISQHSVFGKIRGNAVLINNKGAKFTEPSLPRALSLPFVNAADAGFVFKTLSSGRFDW